MDDDVKYAAALAEQQLRRLGLADMNLDELTVERDRMRRLLRGTDEE